VRYARGVIESFVDLTYRGLALGRRIKLTEVRPTTGFVELPAPMPVGTQLALVTDEGLALEATVTWIHEQVAGAERAPGMVVAPTLAGDAAAAWWKARVTLPEAEAPRPRPTRSRPVTVRPRSPTERTRSATEVPPPVAAPAPSMEILAAVDPAAVSPAAAAPANEILAAVDPAAVEPTAASTEILAAVDPVADAPATESLAAVVPLEEAPTVLAPLEPRVIGAAALDPAADLEDRATVAMAPLDPARLAPPAIRRTGEHDVVDDGKATMIMDAIDPATLGLDLPLGADAAPGAVHDEPSAPVITIEADDDGDGDDADGEAAPGTGPAAPGAGNDKPSSSRGFKRRRKRR
jgi:hypothetical protein